MNVSEKGTKVGGHDVNGGSGVGNKASDWSFVDGGDVGEGWDLVG